LAVRLVICISVEIAREKYFSLLKRPTRVVVTAGKNATVSVVFFDGRLWICLLASISAREGVGLVACCGESGE
jgi:hypothetical protein